MTLPRTMQGLAACLSAVLAGLVAAADQLDSAPNVRSDEQTRDSEHHKAGDLPLGKFVNPIAEGADQPLDVLATTIPLPTLPLKMNPPFTMLMTTMPQAARGNCRRVSRHWKSSPRMLNYCAPWGAT